MGARGACVTRRVRLGGRACLRRYYRRRGRSPFVLPPDFAAVLVPLDFGGQRLYVARGIYYGPCAPLHRPFGQILCTDDYGLRLFGAGDYGDADLRKRKRPAHHDDADSVYVVQRENAGLFHVHFGIFPVKPRSCGRKPLFARDARGDSFGVHFAENRLKRRSRPVCYGTAAVSPAYGENTRLAFV